MPKRCLFILTLLLLAAGCGQVPTIAPPAQEPIAAVDNSAWTVLPAADTPIPYPLPTHEIRTAPPLPSATPLPVVPVLGEEWAPEAERETYVSTTVVVAKVGDGPGEIGYWEAPEAGRIWADRFTVDVHGNTYILDNVNHRVARFDPEGRFMGNTLYDPGADVVELAADSMGRTYLLNRGGIVECLDPAGQLLQRYSPPSWLGSIRALAVDEDGMLWITGVGTLANSPTIAGQLYPRVTVPLGKVGEELTLEQQVAMAVPGRLLQTGGPAITYDAYIYNQEGQCIYTYDGELVSVDQKGDVYILRRGLGSVTAYNPQGGILAALTTGQDSDSLLYVSVSKEGVMYFMLWDWDTKDAYRLIRWEAK